MSKSNPHAKSGTLFDRMIYTFGKMHRKTRLFDPMIRLSLWLVRTVRPDKSDYVLVRQRTEVFPDELRKIYGKETRSDSHGDGGFSVMMCGYAMKAGGGEIFPMILANSLKKKGITVTFVNFNMEPEEAGVSDRLSADIPVVNLTSLHRLPELISKYNPDIIHTHHGSVDSLISRFIMGTGYRQVVTLHGMYESMESDELDALVPQVVKTCRMFFYISDKNLSPFRERNLFKDGIFRKMPNGVEEPHTSSISRADFGIPEDAFVISLVSRARLDKGWMETVEAVDRLNQRSQKKIHLLLAGTGEAYDRLRNETSEYVHLLGFYPAPTDLFDISDVGLLPSYYNGESFPLSVLECLSTGTPMISSDVGEIPNMLTDDDGRVAGIIIKMTKGDSDAIENAISAVMDDRPRFETMRETARNLKARYDIDAVAEEYLAQYRGLM